MESRKLTESVLRPVILFLDEALGQVETSAELSQTAMPLIQAIEAIPGAGRVAVYLGEHGEGPSFISGPSFTEDEIDTLSRCVSDTMSDRHLDRHVSIDLPFEADPGNRARLFPLAVPGERPTVYLIMVRDPVDDDDLSVIDTFLDRITHLAGIVVEDRRLRSKITDQQSLLRVVLAAAPDAIIRIDRAGTILDFMGSAHKVFGWDPEDIVGKPISTLMPEPYATWHGQYIDAYLETGERKLPDFGRQLEARHKSGAVFPVEIALNQVPGQNDIEFIGIVRDISRRVARESEIDALREALDAASLQSALGEFAAIIAHELNQPLTAVANYMDALELRLGDPTEENISEALELARKTAAQARLGGKVIARTRRMALRGESEPKMDDFQGAVSEAMSMLSYSPLAKSAAIRLSHEGISGMSLFDRVQIQQIVINLANNALRAMSEMENPVLTVMTHQSDDQLKLVVRDVGPGIPEGDKAKIFDRFFRRSRNGMGLGLSIVRRLAIAHGGDIHLSDAIEGGAEFTLTLPRRVR